MTLVTITGDTVRDSVGRKDNRPWYAWAADYQDGNPGVITPRRSKPLIPSNGVLSFEIEAGISAWIENPDGQRYLVTIPLVDGSLWEVIEAGVAFPPDTDQERLIAAVTPIAESVGTAAAEAAAPAAVGQAAADMNPIPVAGPTPGKIAISFNGTTGDEFNPLPASWDDLVGRPDLKLAFPDTSITYDGDNVATVTEEGVTTTYTYNIDGTVDTDTRLGVTRQYTYDGDGNLTTIEVI